jgi:two-component system nitrogen regulation sensor histidine kinase NtrY
MGVSGPRTLITRVVAEKVAGGVAGYVVTLDDITALVSAQRKAAWADVARRIAHEIKNPLTPIQLAAERLQRKYQKEITTDVDTFVACTKTIVRRVEDIRRMVDEFSAFARMPRPELKPENLSELVRQAVFLERNRNPALRFDLTLPEDDIILICDSRQIAQVLTNLLKNASEAIEENRGESDMADQEGTIWVTVNREAPEGEAERVAIVIADNGCGLPVDCRDRLTEPYVTSRAKGTGLGLAIVKKITEDHNADLIFEDRENGGARVKVIFHGTEGRFGLDDKSAVRPVVAQSLQSEAM